MERLLTEGRFDFLNQEHKAFMLRFDQEMRRLGYDYGGRIVPGACWGKYMILYRKTGLKSENVFARIYLRDSSIVLRLFLNQIDKHREYIEKAPAWIKEVFYGPHGDCEHCHNEKDGKCKFRKTYSLENRVIEKCNGIVFEFQEPDLSKMADYLALFIEFFPPKKMAE